MGGRGRVNDDDDGAAPAGGTGFATVLPGLLSPSQALRLGGDEEGHPNSSARLSLDRGALAWRRERPAFALIPGYRVRRGERERLAHLDASEAKDGGRHGDVLVVCWRGGMGGGRLLNLVFSADNRRKGGAVETSLVHKAAPPFPRPPNPIVLPTHATKQPITSADRQSPPTTSPQAARRNCERESFFPQKGQTQLLLLWPRPPNPHLQ
jgi:hypothetical protein